MFFPQSVGETTFLAVLMTMVYNPFEGNLPSLRAAVPRNLDFYVGKKNLIGDFNGFPEPKFWFEVEQSLAFARLRQTEFVRAEAERQVKTALTELERVEGWRLPSTAPTSRSPRAVSRR